MRVCGSRFWLWAGWLAVALPAVGQPPHVRNAKFEERPVGAQLEREFRARVAAQASPAWFAYAVPVVPGERQVCCFSSEAHTRWGGCCRLEGSDGFNVSTDASTSVKLEGPARLLVLFRVAEQRVGRIAAFTEDCELDAGGHTFVWLGDVRPEESVGLLASFVRADAASREATKLSERGVAAIALHGHAAADQALESFVASGQPEALRKHAAFWLGAERGRRGYEVLRKFVRDDPSERLREHAIFALSISKEPEAVEAIITAARNDRSSRVRGQALFWLAQKAGKKAVGVITEAMEKDPETQVKEKAVFALSQLPKDEGVPLLIQVARTNPNPAVRKKAMFWLGQSKDPRALAFFEEILRP